MCWSCKWCFAKMTTPRIKAFGFDLDKTLYPPHPEIDMRIREYLCLDVVTRLSGRDHDEVHEEFYRNLEKSGSGSRTVAKMLSIGREEARPYVDQAQAEANIVDILKRDPKLVGLLKLIKDACPTFLITSSDEEMALRKLEALGVRRHSAIFSMCFYAGSEYAREDGSAFRYVSEKLNVPFPEMIFVGDREGVDIVPANRLGIKTARVHIKPDEETVADYRLETIYELRRFLPMIG